MKKSLLALAVLGAFAGAAQAQSSVSVYGILDVGMAATANDSNATAAAAVTKKTARNTGNGDGGLSTSRLGFRGVEDLGKGLSAQFVLEYDLVNVGVGGAGADSATANTLTNNASTGTGFGARYAYVGLSDKAMGTVRLGRQEQPVFTVLAGMGLAGAANNMAGSIYSSGANTAVNDAEVRPVTVFINQAVTYISPTISGVTVTAQTAVNAFEANNTVRSAGVRESGGSITYTGVKNLEVGYGIAMQDINVTAVTGVAPTADVAQTLSVAQSSQKFTQQAIAANYNFGFIRPFVNYTSIKNTVSGVSRRDQSAFEFGVRAPVSPAINVWASGFTGTKKDSANGATLTGLSSTNRTGAGSANIGGWQVGSTYAFSKRTTAYAIYGTQNQKGKDAANGTKIESVGYTVGMRHSF
jgi:predicted porin